MQRQGYLVTYDAGQFIIADAKLLPVRVTGLQGERAQVERDGEPCFAAVHAAGGAGVHAGLAAASACHVEH